MKSLILSILFALIISKTHAQITFINQPQADVVRALKADKDKVLIEGSTLKNGDISLLYDDKHLMSHGYIFRNGTCIQYIMGGQKEWLIDFVENLNKAYKKVSDTEYISQNLLYKVKINFVDDSFFAVFQKI